MKNLKKILKPLLLLGAGALAIDGFNKYAYIHNADVYREGVVINEKYIQPMTIGESKYLLTIKSKGKTFVLDVLDSWDSGSKEALDILVKKGSVIKFKDGDKKWNNNGKTIYYPDLRYGRGEVFTSNIRVL